MRISGSSPGFRPRESVFHLADGRKLAWLERGDPDGRAVVYCHGFPGCATEVDLLADAAARAGVRLIAPDRPGFGASSPHPGRELDDWPADLDQLLAALGLDRCRVLGMSGGGPYALACGAALADRVEAIALVGALGPLERPAARHGMAPFARISIALAQRRPRLQAALFHAVAASLRTTPAAILRLMLTGETPADRAALAQPDMRAALLAGMRGALRQGARAAIAELRLYVRSWPFALSAISAPVQLWHGEADPVVPPEHGRALAAALPQVKSTFLPDEGHFSMPIRYGETILRALVAAQRD